MFSRLGKFLPSKKEKDTITPAQPESEAPVQSSAKEDPRFKNINYGSLTLKHPANKEVLAEMTDSEVQSMTYSWRAAVDTKLRQERILLSFYRIIKDIDKAKDDVVIKVLGNNIKSLSYTENNKEQTVYSKNESAPIKISVLSTQANDTDIRDFEVCYEDQLVLKVHANEFEYGFDFNVSHLVPGRWLKDIMYLLEKGVTELESSILATKVEAMEKSASEQAQQTMKYLNSADNKLANISVAELNSLSNTAQVNVVHNEFRRFIESKQIDLGSLYEILVRNDISNPEYKKIIDVLGVAELSIKHETVSFRLTDQENIKYTLIEDDFDLSFEYTLEMIPESELDGRLGIRQSGRSYSAIFIGGNAVNQILEMLCDKLKPAQQLFNNYMSSGAALDNKQLIEMSMTIE